MRVCKRPSYAMQCNAHPLLIVFPFSPHLHLHQLPLYNPPGDDDDIDSVFRAHEASSSTKPPSCALWSSNFLAAHIHQCKFPYTYPSTSTHQNITVYTRTHARHACSRPTIVQMRKRRDKDNEPRTRQPPNSNKSGQKKRKKRGKKYPTTTSPSPPL